MTRPDLFNFVIGALRYGATLDELSEKLNECVNASRETGKVSKLTLELTIKPNGSTGQYELTDKIKSRVPELDREVTLMFGTPEGNLVREDPRQMKLDLRRVEDPPAADLRKVSP